MRFTLKPRQWYTCELISVELEEDQCSYSAIKVLGGGGLKGGWFWHLDSRILSCKLPRWGAG